MSKPRDAVLGLRTVIFAHVRNNGMGTRGLPKK